MSSMEPHFRMVERHRPDGTTIVDVAGEIHVSTAPAFNRGLSDLVRAGHLSIVLDLTDVEFIDSTGLSVLLSALRRITRSRGRLALVCANPTVLRLFEITHLDRTFDIRPALEPALELVQAPAAGSDAGMP